MGVGFASIGKALDLTTPGGRGMASHVQEAAPRFREAVVEGVIVSSAAGDGITSSPGSLVCRI
jgi:hypothetical protein